MRSLRVSASRGLSSCLSNALARPGWVYPSCSHGRRITRWSSTSPSSSSSSSDPPKPFYVTTPIFYVNASPHVGHMYSMFLADAIKRWQTLRRRPALLCTGTDEHGMKVQRAAAQNGVPAKEFCDENADKFRDLARVCGMDNDFFVRTTDADHVDAVQHFWFLLRERGFIYETTHSGWYCISDECFYAENEIERTIVPQTGRTVMASTATGNEVEWTEEKNYHFRMTALRDDLLAFYERNPDWILPRSRMNEVVSWVRNNLEDLSVSRPVSRLDWGIRVPDDPSQTIYVWVDALINYITKAGFPRWPPGAEGAEKRAAGGWPADVQVIGKDILRFHGVYWPALLMAVSIPPPRQLLTHGHWTLGKRKMSKSIGNVVNPFFAIDRWGLDAVRYFMLRDGGIERDADYENSLIFARYEKDLRSTLGNLLSRVVKSWRWTLARAVTWAREDGRYGAGETIGTGRAVEEARSDDVARHCRDDKTSLVERIGTTAPTMDDVMGGASTLNPGAALRVAMDLLVEANKYLAAAAPWELDAQVHVQNDVVFHAAEAVRVAGILMQPFMPGKMTELLDVLGVADDRRSFEHAVFGADLDYGVPKDPTMLKKGKWAGLFAPASAER